MDSVKNGRPILAGQHQQALDLRNGDLDPGQGQPAACEVLALMVDQDEGGAFERTRMARGTGEFEQGSRCIGHYGLRARVAGHVPPRIPMPSNPAIRSVRLSGASAQECAGRGRPQVGIPSSRSRSRARISTSTSIVARTRGEHTTSSWTTSQTSRAGTPRAGGRRVRDRCR